VTTLRTRRLVLRPARADDLDAFHAILSDPRATRYWSTPPHETREQSLAWLTAMVRSPPELAADFVVEFEGRVVGKAGFYRLPEIGFILSPDVWGRGMAREAVAAVIDHVFAERGLTELTADVDPRNEASIRVLEGAGFRKTGAAERTFQIGDAWVDSLYYSLDRETWRRRLMIRAAGDADIPALLPLIEGAYRGEGSRRGWTTEADLLGGQRTDAAALAEIIADPKQAILMAAVEGALVGSVLMADRGDGTGYLGMLSVDPTRQAGGIGKALVKAVEAGVVERFGARRIEMQVFWQRDSLIAWYERMGYRRTGETRPFPMDNPRMGLPLRDDLWFVVLEKDLDAKTP